MCSHSGLLGKLNLADALAGSHHVLVLDAHNTTSPCAAEFVVLVELDGECLLELIEVSVVFFIHVGESNAGGSLAVHKLTKVSLAADEAVSNTLLAAECRKEAHHLDRVNVMGDND